MPVLPFPIGEAQLISLFAESTVFGMHVLSTARCVSALLWSGSQRKRGLEIRWPMVLLSLALLLNAAFHAGLGLYHNVQAFLFYKGEGGPAEDFENVTGWIDITLSLSIIVQTMIGDAMLIYRCWVVYDRSAKPIAVPAVLWVGCLAATVWGIFLEATLHTRVVVVDWSQILTAGALFWGLTVALNVSTTSLLIWRLWGVDKLNRRLRTLSGPGASASTSSEGGSSKLRKIMLIIVESGLLYTAAAVAAFVAWVVQTNGVYVVMGVEIQIVGISFNLIIIRATALARRASEDPHALRSEPRTVPLIFSPPSQGTISSNDDGDDHRHHEEEEEDVEVGECKMRLESTEPKIEEASHDGLSI